MKEIIKEDLESLWDEFKNAGSGVLWVIKGVLTIIYRALIIFCAATTILGELVVYCAELLVKAYDKIKSEIKERVEA